MNEITFAVKYSIEELQKMILDPVSCKPVIIFDGKPVHEINSIEPLPGESFRLHKKSQVEVSNFGRVKYENEILEQFVNEGEKESYLRVTKRGICADYVYRLVAETWCEKPDDGKDYEVHHITNNGFDNRPCNLLWVTKEQHHEIDPRPWERYQK